MLSFQFEKILLLQFLRLLHFQMSYKEKVSSKTGGGVLNPAVTLPCRHVSQWCISGFCLEMEGCDSLSLLFIPSCFSVILFLNGGHLVLSPRGNTVVNSVAYMNFHAFDDSNTFLSKIVTTS